MFKYLHSYGSPETWQAQIDRGFVNSNSGIRFCESIDIEEKNKFNNLARKDGHLYNYLKETKCPLYIDRLQGGYFVGKIG